MQDMQNTLPPPFRDLKVSENFTLIDDFGILKDRINTAISLVDTIEITNKYF